MQTEVVFVLIKPIATENADLGPDHFLDSFDEFERRFEDGRSFHEEMADLVVSGEWCNFDGTLT